MSLFLFIVLITKVGYDLKNEAFIGKDEGRNNTFISIDTISKDK